MAQSGSRPPSDLREQILAFVRSLRQPVLVPALLSAMVVEGQAFSLSPDDGGEPASDGAGQPSGSSAGRGWRLEVEFGKLLLEVWGAGGSAVRRIESAEQDGSRLRVWARKPGWAGEQVALVIREAADDGSGPGEDSNLGQQVGYSPEPAMRRARDRGGFERDLVAMLGREFPSWSLERVSHRPDREHYFSGCYSRGWARRGREAWAFLGLSELEGPSATENALAYGLIWLDWLRERSAGTPARSRTGISTGAGNLPRVTGLKLLLPPAAVAVAAHRAAYLDPTVAQIEILEWTPRQDHPRPVDLRDYGNVETRLTPRGRGARLTEQLRPLLIN
ncbi:MAG TPA: hypothetical protein VI455_04195 [Terriglobia bacterium]